MSHIVAEIEDMIVQYLKAKYDDNEIVNMDEFEFRDDFMRDEDGKDEFADRLLYIVLDQIHWGRIFEKEKAKSMDALGLDEDESEDENENENSTDED